MTVLTSTGRQPRTLESYLGMRASTCLPAEPPVRRVVELTQLVWAIELEGGEKVVAKYHADGAVTSDQPHDVLAVECRILELLAAQGCPVPRVLSVDAQTLFIFYEHGGDRTIDDLCQEPPIDGGEYRELGRELVAGFCRIDSVLNSHRDEIQHLVTPAARIRSLPATAARVKAGALEGLAKLLNLCGNEATALSLATCIREISHWLSGRAPTLGSTDYNARNVVVDSAGGELTFIEFARVGWDWPERRLVQYATSLGAGRPDGRFVSLVDPGIVEFYAQRQDDDVDGRAAALDGHHILFNLNAAAMLFRALAEPHMPGHCALLRAWHNPERRIAQLVEAIAAPLTANRLCAQFRNAFATTVRHSSMEIDT